MSALTSPPADRLVDGDRWDVVIVGARVAGASTALLLARAGLRVLVVDRARRGTDTLSTHALMRGGVLQLRRWGLLDRVRASGAPPVRRVTFHYGGESVPITLKPYAGVDALYAPRRTVLDAILVDAAEAAGARFSFGQMVVEVVRARRGTVIGVLARDHDGRTSTVRAQLVVGADGRGSAVAASVAAPTIRAGHHTAAYAYGYWAAADLDGYHWHYGDGLSAGSIPTNDGRACVFVGGPPSVLAAAQHDARPQDVQRRLLARIDGSLADLVAAPPTGAVRFFRGLPGRLRRPYGAGWALVGDASCWKDPLSTHGITASLHDAELLTAAIVRGCGNGLAMADYQTQRDRTAVPILSVADRLASHAWNPSEVRRLLREMSSLMADEVEAICDVDARPARAG